MADLNRDTRLSGSPSTAGSHRDRRWSALAILAALAVLASLGHRVQRAGATAPGPVRVLAPQPDRAVNESPIGVRRLLAVGLTDTIRANEEGDFLTGTAGDDVLIGGGGDDRLRGLGGDDVLQGEAGRDLLEGGAGSDILEGGEGDDNLEGGSEQDFLFGDAGDDVLRGGDGPDVLDGGAGNDEISGGPGDDTLDGGEGDDVLRGGDGDDMLDGADGNDVLLGGAGADDLSGGDGADVIRGGSGDDIISGGDGDDDLSGGIGNDAILGGDGADVIRGGPGDDVLGGGDGPDVLFGGAGDDLLNGSGGADQLFGGPGDDTLLDDSADGVGGDDYLSGGPGNDRLQSGHGEDRLDGGPGNDTLDPGVNTDHTRGGPGDDVVILVAGDVDEGRIEVIEGGPGADTLLLDGFRPQDISEMIERTRAASDSTSVPEFSFTVTDPSTTGLYQVSQMEVVRYVTRLPLAEWGEGTKAVILNPSASTVAEVELDFVGGDGQSLLYEPEDSVAQWASVSIAPRGLAEVTGEGFGVSGVATVRIRSNTPVSAVVVGELADLGRVGYADVSSRHRATGLFEFDRDAGTSMLLALATDGVDRKVHVRLVPEVDSKEFEVSGGGSALIDLGELFPNLTSWDDAVQVVGGPIHGVTIQVGPGDLGAMSFPLWDNAFRRPVGPPPEEGDEMAPLYGGFYFFPGAVSADRGATLTLQHVRAPGTAGTVKLHGEAGETITIGLAGGESEDSLEFALEGPEQTQFEIEAASDASSLRIKYRGSVAAVLLQDYGSSGAVRRGPAVVGDDLMVPIVGPDRGADVRIDLQSLDEDAEIELTLRDTEGEEVRSGQATLRISAMGTATTNLAELFPDVDTDGFVGSLGIISSSPVAASVVHLLPPERAGFELPVRPVNR